MLPQETPIYPKKSPVYLQKSPIFPQKNPVYLQNGPLLKTSGSNSGLKSNSSHDFGKKEFIHNSLMQVFTHYSLGWLRLVGSFKL